MAIQVSKEEFRKDQTAGGEGSLLCLKSRKMVTRTPDRKITMPLNLPPYVEPTWRVLVSLQPKVGKLHHHHSPFRLMHLDLRVH
jgi:hypothetical protein